jgi:putative membrane protein
VVTWLVRAAAILVVSYIGVGIRVDGIGTAILAAVVLSLVDLIVKPILTLLTLPATVVTFGLFIFVVNGIMLLIVGAIVPGFTVRGLLAAIVGSILIGIVGTAIQAALKLI